MKWLLIGLTISGSLCAANGAALQDEPEYYVTRYYNTSPQHCGTTISLSARDRTSGTPELDLACLISGSRNIAWITLEEVTDKLDFLKNEFEKSAQSENIREFKGVSFRPEGERNALLLILLNLQKHEYENDYLRGLLLEYPIADIEFFYQRPEFHSYLHQLDKATDNMLWTYPEFSDEQKQLFNTFIKNVWIGSEEYQRFAKDKEAAHTWIEEQRKHSIEQLYKQITELEQQPWQDMEKEVGSWVDGLGMPIDPGIKDTVIALNLLGFKTRASCEGHIDRGLSYPWIDFETKNQEIVNLETKRDEINNQIAERREEIQKKYPDLPIGEALHREEFADVKALYQEMHMLGDQIAHLSKSQLMPLKNLLEQFYKSRTTDPDKMITIHALNPTFLRMYSLGGDWQVTRNDNERALKLKEYQQEMNEFTDFLKNQYFEE